MYSAAPFSPLSRSLLMCGGVLQFSRGCRGAGMRGGLGGGCVVGLKGSGWRLVSGAFGSFAVPRHLEIRRATFAYRMLVYVLLYFFFFFFIELNFKWPFHIKGESLFTHHRLAPSCLSYQTVSTHVRFTPPPAPNGLRA